MSITCPQCQFKGLIDTAPEAFERPLTCVRCGAAFDVQPIGEEVQTVTPPDACEDFPEAAVAPDSAVQAAQHDSAAQDVLALPQAQDAYFQRSEQESVTDDVLHVLPAYAEPTSREAALVNQTEEIAEKPAAVLEEIEVQSADAQQPAETLQSVNEPGFKFGQTHGESQAESEMPNVGMRLMRISPLWLLVCGMTFLSVIILSNQFAARAEPEPRVASNFTQPGNKATNQALPQPPAPATNNVQDVSQTTATQAPVESKNEPKVVGEKSETKADENTAPAAAPNVAPVAENKSEPVIAAPPPTSEKAGGFTIQVGSYNAIEEANERVARLQAGGFDVRVVSVELPKRGTWYRVQSGRFGSREEAGRHGQAMKSKGATDSFIITEAQGGK